MVERERREIEQSARAEIEVPGGLGWSWPVFVVSAKWGGEGGGRKSSGSSTLVYLLASD